MTNPEPEPQSEPGEPETLNGMLDRLGIKPLPPDDPIYSSGALVLFSSEPSDGDTQPVCTIPDCSHDDNLHCPVLRAELDALGSKPVPPDHWVYRQGTAFIFDQPADERPLDAD